MIALIGLVIGIVAGLVLEPAVPLWLEPYLPIAVIAALDAVVGATRALLDGVFRDRVFVISFGSVTCWGWAPRCPPASWWS